MTTGIMEVKLIAAKGLKRSDFPFGRIDPYVIIQYRNEEQKSNLAQVSGKGGRRVWNEEFRFRVDLPAPDGDDNYQNNYKLFLNIFDRDTFTKDDYLGRSTIYLKELFEVGLEKGKAELGRQKYRVVLNDLTYHGEIQVAITFTVKSETDHPKYLMEMEKENTSFLSCKRYF